MALWEFASEFSLTLSKVVVRERAELKEKTTLYKFQSFISKVQLNKIWVITGQGHVTHEHILSMAKENESVDERVSLCLVKFALRGFKSKDSCIKLTTCICFEARLQSIHSALCSVFVLLSLLSIGLCKHSIKRQIGLLSNLNYSTKEILIRKIITPPKKMHLHLHFGPETGSVVSKAKCGRPEVTAPSDDRYIRLSFQRDRKAASSQIQNFLNKQCKTLIR